MIYTLFESIIVLFYRDISKLVPWTGNLIGAVSFLLGVIALLAPQEGLLLLIQIFIGIFWIIIGLILIMTQLFQKHEVVGTNRRIIVSQKSTLRKSIRDANFEAISGIQMENKWNLEIFMVVFFFFTFLVEPYAFGFIFMTSPELIIVGNILGILLGMLIGIVVAFYCKIVFYIPGTILSNWTGSGAEPPIIKLNLLKSLESRTQLLRDIQIFYQNQRDIVTGKKRKKVTKSRKKK
jgi:hypothetical protein